MVFLCNFAAGVSTVNELNAISLGKQHSRSCCLGVVGVEGLGQFLSFNMGLLLIKTATILGAMLLMVTRVDSLSFGIWRKLSR